MSLPLISVLMPVYNASDFVEKAVESVLSQTFRNFELLILDDCSTDDTLKKVSNFNDARIKIFRNPKNLKIAETLNIGFLHAQGSLIARMDADDICQPQRFQKQVEYLEKNLDVDLVGTGYSFIDDSGIESYHFKPTTNRLLLRWRLFFGNEFCHPSVMFRKKILDSGLRYGMIPEAYQGYWPSTQFSMPDLAEDYLFFGMIALDHGVANLEEPLLKYRIHQNSTSVSRMESQQEKKKLISLFLLSLFLKQKVTAFRSETIKELYSHFSEKYKTDLDVIRRDFDIQLLASATSIREGLVPLMESLRRGDVFQYDHYQKVRALKFLLPQSLIKKLKKMRDVYASS